MAKSIDFNLVAGLWGEISQEYIKTFKNIVREEFEKQAGKDGKVELVFRRIFLTALKV
jgi:trans-aconitate methyltransferase